MFPDGGVGGGVGAPITVGMGPLDALDLPLSQVGDYRLYIRETATHGGAYKGAVILGECPCGGDRHANHEGPANLGATRTPHPSARARQPPRGLSSALACGGGGSEDPAAMGPGDWRRVDGDISAFGTDAFDSYRLAATAATTFEIGVAPAGGVTGGDGDVDLWLADADGRVVELLDSEGAESGTLLLAPGEQGVLVMTGFGRDLPYELTVRGAACP